MNIKQVDSDEWTKYYYIDGVVYGVDIDDQTITDSKGNTLSKRWEADNRPLVELILQHHACNVSTTKYELPSKAASFEGRVDGFGNKEFTLPNRRKDVDAALKEALIELAKRDYDK